MENDRFDVLASSPVRWAYEAYRQFLIGSHLLPLHNESVAEFIKLTQLIPRQQQRIDQLAQSLKASTGASMFHFGLAIENAYKTRKILDGDIQVENGKFKNLNVTHNVLEMIKNCNVFLTEEEVDIIRSITFATQSGGKYPIAKDANKQRDFTGRVYGPDTSQSLVEKVCLNILKDEPYISIFRLGALSGVKDTA